MGRSYEVAPEERGSDTDRFLEKIVGEETLSYEEMQDLVGEHAPKGNEQPDRDQTG